ncbi:hypothetical protein QBC46DRAFT_261079 [Diplogelasinospora grovesii]|uniref:Uncharacterized protein n=1 Tax=Diplogelasinospora grovesii TaxID=303347 RepID=A0AAN6S4Q1_9PEZI|nr:hypothetical protein QBC46DRAFT_261079 [Diplogelasinospora grovesii]
MEQNSSFRSADPADGDEVLSEYAPSNNQQASPVKGKGKGRGRWPAKQSKAKVVTKPAPAKPATGRGRRTKAYDCPKAQAAYERMAELKNAYNTVAKGIKPALQELAERNINQLLQNPKIVEEVPEWGKVQDWLDNHVEEIKKKADMELGMFTAMAKHVYDAEVEATRRSTATLIEELCDDKVDELLAALDMLEYLHDNNLPVDLTALPEDAEYTYKEITQEQADNQSTYVEMRDGIEVPFSGKLCSELMSKDRSALMSPTAAPKRKADGQPEGQPSSKMVATAKDDDVVPEMPRHTGGLLSAVDSLDDRPSTPQENGSNMGSNAPTPAPADAPSPGTADIARTGSGEITPSQSQELPIPRGATGPDEYGVRLISRRATRLDIPNNRIMVPGVIHWDDEDIGFRDSTNNPEKGATKARRGRYLGKPGSNAMFIDRRVGTWDSTNLEDDDLDEELVKKYKLHPTLGIVLDASVNESEPPTPIVSGMKPVVLRAPNGEEIHTSRSVAAARREQRAQKVEAKMELQKLSAMAREREGIALEDVAPDQEALKAHRKAKLTERGIDPNMPTPEQASRRETPELAQDDTIVEEEEADAAETTAETTPATAAAFEDLVRDIVEAAAAIEGEEEASRAASTKRPQPSTRPYDAIRDVFTDTSVSFPAPLRPSPPPPPRFDTYFLSCLADAAEQEQQQQSMPQQSMPQQSMPQQIMPQQQGAYHQDFPPAYHQPGEMAQQPPPHFMRQSESPRPNEFLRTALNHPQPTAYSPPPGMALPVAAQEYLGMAMAPAMPPQGQPTQTTGRSPFSSTGSTKGLPALRPVRSLLNDGMGPSPPAPETTGSPSQHPAMMVTNSGTFYPPAPTRPFHNGYLNQERLPGPAMPMQQPMQQPMGQHPQQMRPYSMSPPEYHNVPKPLLAPGPPPPPPPPPAGPPLMPETFTRQTQSPRSKTRPLRKIEPAPTGPNRSGNGGNGRELKTIHFDYRKDFGDHFTEAPPKHGPTTIRGWSINKMSKPRQPRTGGGGSASASGSGGTRREAAAAASSAPPSQQQMDFIGTPPPMVDLTSDDRSASARSGSAGASMSDEPS